MKRLLWSACFALTFPAVAQSAQIDTEFNGLNIEWQPFAVATAAVADQPIPAVTLTNRSEQRALCQFVGKTEQTGGKPTLVLEPLDTAVLRTPVRSAAEGSVAVLRCVQG